MKSKRPRPVIAPRIPRHKRPMSKRDTPDEETNKVTNITLYLNNIILATKISSHVAVHRHEFLTKDRNARAWCRRRLAQRPAAGCRGSRFPTARPNPSHRRGAHVAVVDLAGQRVLGRGVGEDLLAELAESPDQR